MVFWSNDFQLTSLGYGLLLGVVGACISCLGLRIWASIIATAGNARLLLGPKGQDASARVLAKETKRIGGSDVDRQGAGLAQTYHLCSYVFDAVRADGVTCRIEVRQRKVPSFVWEALQVGDSAKVRFLHDEPRVCRLRDAAWHEKSGAMSMKLRTLVGALFFGVGAAAMALSVVDHHLAGAIAWTALVELYAMWLCGGRAMLQRVWPQEAWSPLFVFPGYVFIAELGHDVQPSSEPVGLIPGNVDMVVGLPRAGALPKKKDLRSWTQQYESEQRQNGVV